MSKDHVVVGSYDNDEGNRCVDVVQQADGRFRFEHWRREPEDLSGWILLLQSTPIYFDTQQQAIEAATQAVPWFKQPE